MTKKEHIKELRKNKQSYSEIAKFIGCSKSYVQKVLNCTPKYTSIQQTKQQSIPGVPSVQQFEALESKVEDLVDEIEEVFSKLAKVDKQIEQLFKIVRSHGAQF